MILNPHSCSVPESNFQNSSAACSVPFRAFLNLTYSIVLPFWFYHMCFLYRLGSSFTISSTIGPSSSICTLCSMSACRKAAGMSVTITHLRSFASIAHENIIASNDTVDELTLSFVIYTHWSLPSAHPCAFFEPLRFSFRKIRYIIELFHSSYGISTFLSCNCLISFRFALFPYSPKVNWSSLIFIGVNITWTCFWVGCRVLPFWLHSCNFCCDFHIDSFLEGYFAVFMKINCQSQY